MGQPIHLVSPDGEPLTVYGRHQMAVHLAEGYVPAEEYQPKPAEIPADDLHLLDGATDDIIQGLADLGLTTYAKVAAADEAELTSVKGVGKATAAKLKSSAEELVDVLHV